MIELGDYVRFDGVPGASGGPLMRVTGITRWLEGGDDIHVRWVDGEGKFQSADYAAQWLKVCPAEAGEIRGFAERNGR